MRIGIVHPALGVEDLKGIFARAARAGADGVEVHYPSPAVATALNQFDHARELAALAAKSGVAVGSLCLDCLRGEPALIGRPVAIQRTQELIRQALVTAAAAGAPAVIVPFFGKNTIELEEELDRAADALAELVDDAADAGVVLGVDSTLNFHQMHFLLNRLGDTGDVKIACNTGIALARKLDGATGIRDLGAGAIAQVRFHDVRIAEGRPPDFGVPFGEGDVDFGAIAQALRAVGYDGWIVVQPPLADNPRKILSTARTALRVTRELLGSVAAD
jgi:L-ribulose-5-phosphate 3-epimerase